jgi:peptide/nickel transport system substrate-binding protein
MKKLSMTCLLLTVFSLLPVRAAPFVFPANWTTNTPQEVTRGGTYQDANLGDFRTYNPFLGTEAGSLPRLLSAGGLFRLDPTTREYLPYMAESYSLSRDKLTWTIKLRSGMKWSDGSPITSDDFITTWRIHLDPDVISSLRESFLVFNRPVMLKALDPLTIRATFPAVTADAIATLSFLPVPTKIFAPVYSSKGAAGIRAMWTLNEKPSSIVTSGAFRLVSYSLGERVLLERNPFFGEWNVDSSGNPLPYLEAVRYTIAKTSASLLTLFLSGELDTYAPPNTDALAQIKGAITAGNLKAELRANAASGTGSEWIAFNWNKKSNPQKQALFRDVRFRRAMSHLVNRQAMIDLAFGGLAQPVYSSVHPVFRDWQSPNFAHFEFNPARATQLLSELGFRKRNTDGYLTGRDGQILEFDLVTNAGNSPREMEASVFAEEARKVGVKVNLRPADGGTVIGLLRSTGDDRPFDAMLLGSGGSFVFLPLAANIISCQGTLHVYNQSGHCLMPFETQIGALFDRARLEPDPKQQRVLVRQIQEIEALNQPFVYVLSVNVSFAWASRVRGEFPAKIADGLTRERLLALTWIAPENK